MLKHYRMRIAVLEKEHRVNVSDAPADSDALPALLSEWKELGHRVSVFRISSRRRGAVSDRKSDRMHILLPKLLSEPFDCIYIRSRSLLLFGLFLRFLKRSPGIVVSWPKDERECGESTESGCAERSRLLSVVADRIALSDTSAAPAVRDRYGEPAAILVEAPNIRPQKTTDALRVFELRAWHYMLFASDIVKRSDLLSVVRAFRDLEETGKLPNNFKLVVLGRLSFAPETEPYLRSAIGKRESILLLGEQRGQIRREIFSHASIFVQPGRSASGANLLEALGYALPIVANDSSENREVLGDAGEYVGNGESLRDALSALLVRPEAASALCDAAKERFVRYFSPKSDAARLLELFEEAIRLRAGEHYSIHRTERHV